MKSLNPRRQSAKDGIHFELREQLLAAVLDALAAVALSSPSKSDLQQRDILIVEDAARPLEQHEINLILDQTRAIGEVP